MGDTLEIRPGGILVNIYWDSESRTYKEKDVTDSAVRRLWDRCRVADGVILRDVFLLLNTQLDIFDSLLANWCKEIVTEGLKEPVPIPENQREDQKIEYLELYWQLECSRFEQEEWTMAGMSHPEFHGVGVELTKDSNEPGGYKKGDRILWSVCFRKANELAPYPLRLKDTISVSTVEYMRKPLNQNDKVTEFPAAEFTLGHILYGVIWELSFHGNPEMRDEKRADLLQTSEDVKAGRVPRS